MSDSSAPTGQDDLPLRGVGVGGFRSLRDVQFIAPMGKVTLLAGQNNAGKSNVLRFVSDYLSQPPGGDWHNIPQPPGPEGRLQMAFRVPSVADLQELDPGISDLSGLLQHPAFRHVDGSEDLWLQYSTDSKVNSRSAAWVLDREYLSSILDSIGSGADTFRRASSALTGTSGGSRTDDIVRVLERLFPLKPIQTERVEAFRQISTGGASSDSDTSDFNGRELIKRLAELRDPPARDYGAKRAKFDAINHFAQAVLEDATVQLHIPASQDDIQVEQGGLVLPLTSMGTGIHQVIIIAAAASILDKTVLCIEEPEVNLHPLLQRKLVRYLSEATTNQYIIATHSAHMRLFTIRGVVGV